MKLTVVEDQSPPDKSPWYARGLRFTCTECGNCCTGGPGYVWVSREEVVKLAAHLQLTPEQTVERYCRTIDGRLSLRENLNADGLYDCIFLVDAPDSTPESPRRICGVYPARPLQCRTWPFSAQNLGSRAAWERSAERCPGMSHGSRRFSRRQIEHIRDATQWPENPPTSERKE